MPVEVFAAGREANPHPPGTAVLRRMRAVPLDGSPWSTWLGPSVNGIRAWRRLVDRRAGSVVGHAWIRRSALRWRWAAWSVWGAALVATSAWSWRSEGAAPGAASIVGGVLVGLVVVALLLVAARVRAVIDPADGRVGVRG